MSMLLNKMIQFRHNRYAQGVVWFAPATGQPSTRKVRRGICVYLMDMKRILFLGLFLYAATAYAQKTPYQGFPSLYWPKLYDITFTQGRDELGEFQKPVFSEAVKALRDKVIILPGYMVPLENETTASTIMLSSLPLNACFFCGVGGPETVVEVHLKSRTRYIEQPVEVRGTLRLNDENPDQMIYVLQDAEVLGTLDY